MSRKREGKKKRFGLFRTFLLLFFVFALLGSCADNDAGMIAEKTELAEGSTGESTVASDTDEVSEKADEDADTGQNKEQGTDEAGKAGVNVGKEADAPEETETSSEDQKKEIQDGEKGNSETTTARIKGFDFREVPDYNGSPVVEVNGNKPFFTDKEKANAKTFESYSKLDSCGRCGTAYANASRELRPTKERGEIGHIKPTGWHTVKYSDRIEGNYLYNRCHLIAYQIAGENDNVKNLITGSRYMNTEGMLPYEIRVMEYLDYHDNHVLYRVTPVFVDKEDLARGVLMEAYSVEDAGKGVSFCVYCYNVQPGVIIDYATGESREDPDYVPTASGSGDTRSMPYTGTGQDDDASGIASGTVSDQDPSKTIWGEDRYEKSSDKVTYVLNTNTRKFHRPSCGSVQDTKSKNRAETTQSRQEVLDAGYSPCGRCHP